MILYPCVREKRNFTAKLHDPIRNKNFRKNSAKIFEKFVDILFELCYYPIFDSQTPQIALK